MLGIDPKLAVTLLNLARRELPVARNQIGEAATMILRLGHTTEADVMRAFAQGSGSLEMARVAAGSSYLRLFGSASDAVAQLRQHEAASRQGLYKLVTQLSPCQREAIEEEFQFIASQDPELGFLRNLRAPSIIEWKSLRGFHGLGQARALYLDPETGTAVIARQIAPGVTALEHTHVDIERIILLPGSGPIQERVRGQIKVYTSAREYIVEAGKTHTPGAVGETPVFLISVAKGGLVRTLFGTSCRGAELLTEANIPPARVARFLQGIRYDRETGQALREEIFSALLFEMDVLSRSRLIRSYAPSRFPTPRELFDRVDRMSPSNRLRWAQAGGALDVAL